MYDGGFSRTAVTDHRPAFRGPAQALGLYGWEWTPSARARERVRAQSCSRVPLRAHFSHPRDNTSEASKDSQEGKGLSIILNDTSLQMWSRLYLPAKETDKYNSSLLQYAQPMFSNTRPFIVPVDYQTTSGSNLSLVLPKPAYFHFRLEGIYPSC